MKEYMYVRISKPKKYKNKIEVVATKNKLTTSHNNLHMYSFFSYMYIGLLCGSG